MTILLAFKSKKSRAGSCLEKDNEERREEKAKPAELRQCEAQPRGGRHPHDKAGALEKRGGEAQCVGECALTKENVRKETLYFLDNSEEKAGLGSCMSVLGEWEYICMAHQHC